ncbi:MAG: signal peptidase I [Bradymonadales bacterium]|nr:signal peptidase I [Bradymonadales bacterium]
MVHDVTPHATYRGETAVRKPAVAFLLTLLCPGLGLLVVGNLAAGVVVNLSYVFVASLFVWLWARLLFFPLVPLAILLAGGGVITLLMALDAARTARRQGHQYLLRPYNHPLVYAAVSLGTFHLPLVFLIHLTFTQLVSLVWIDGDSMYPTLADGDLILVDRTAYRDSGPRHGDLVLVQFGSRDRSYEVGRILAVPTDEVGLPGGILQVNEQVPLWRSLSSSSDALQAQLDALVDVVHPAGSRLAIESIHQRWYFISEQMASFPVVTSQTARLADDEYYVVHDNRSALGDSRNGGAVVRSGILGRPLYIAMSLTADGALRRNRIGRRIQP